MSTTYETALVLHSWGRWLVLALLLALLARVVHGQFGERTWSRGDERLHVALVAAADLQLTLGLWLYFVASPFSSAFLSAPAAALHDTTLRFFGLEHGTMMVLALGALHLGRVLSKRAGSAAQRRRRILVWTLAALALVLVAVPWPFTGTKRPLYRWWSSEAAAH